MLVSALTKTKSIRNIKTKQKFKKKKRLSRGREKRYKK